ncbi:MAG: hypothetical protein KVP17_004476 [Porospora cf. gigantea B]|uniref:uncharacterized protein n=1 Tax=Porospora cf. gigantea B TaxID=2853592 RepID=UPI003571AD50|nr:MAG: hypothetical protein KVP17_004476 [Porospora cf. gigantea B]
MTTGYGIGVPFNGYGAGVFFKEMLDRLFMDMPDFDSNQAEKLLQAGLELRSKAAGQPLESPFHAQLKLNMERSIHAIIYDVHWGTLLPKDVGGVTGHQSVTSHRSRG